MIGKTIKELRKLKNIKQKDFADQCEISTTYLSLIETGKRTPTLETLQKISDALGIPYPILSFLSLDPEEISEEKRELYLKISAPFNELLKSFFVG